MTEKQQCRANTRSGLLCKKDAIAGSYFCWIHGTFSLKREVPWWMWGVRALQALLFIIVTLAVEHYMTPLIWPEEAPITEVYISAIKAITKISSDSLTCNPTLGMFGNTVASERSNWDRAFPSVPRDTVRKYFKVTTMFVVAMQVYSTESWTNTRTDVKAFWDSKTYDLKITKIFSNQYSSEAIPSFSSDEQAFIAGTLKHSFGQMPKRHSLKSGEYKDIIDTFLCVDDCTEFPLEISPVFIVDGEWMDYRLDVHRLFLQFIFYRNLSMSEKSTLTHIDSAFSFTPERIVEDSVICTGSSVISVVSLEINSVFVFEY